MDGGRRNYVLYLLLSGFQMSEQNKFSTCLKEVDSQLDHEFINHIKEDPLRWRQFVEKGEALLALTKALAKLH